MRLQWTTLNITKIGKFVVTIVVTQPLFGLVSGHFTYDNRRGRESNPRIAVLQTATLPLGYPADLREMTYRASIVCQRGEAPRHTAMECWSNGIE